jgi:hypothetical protein
VKRPITRRVLLVGAGATALVVGGGAIGMRSLALHTRSADAEAAEYATLLADVHDDYINGRVVEHHGWVLSQHEFDTIEERKADRRTAATTGVS